ncbi:stage II sporulation protein R [Marininema mesophilum]|uniref:Stage II sporulation protein R n=1 Tax=Marininema mesophilum TaxID=1048340 RepID=A0A1H2T9W3_9BACL|nr:stage II sporulation protein R [Marininema mesophilum]SDW40630.1 stage II sporulation protein R [Marininema mesophilum]
MNIRTIFFFILCAVGLSFYVVGQGEGFLSGEGAVTVSAAEGKSAIPRQAIRLRILANSDSTQDQWLKRQVRDAILAEMGTWAKKPRTLNEARGMVRDHLPILQRIAENTVDKRGYSYSVKMDFGKVPFPTKLYGDQVYPAGKYEALLVTIGKGKGDNWWCVLFPPLCFVDMSNGDAVPKEEKSEATAQALAANQALAAPVQEEKTLNKNEDSLEVRLFFIDSLEKFFSGLFG